MKIPASITSLTLLMAFIPAAHANEDDNQAIIRFQNEDQLTGNLKSLGEDSLVWESDILAEPSTIGLEHVLNLTLAAENKEPKSSHVVILTLKNNDEIHGQLNSVTEDEIAIDTWFAGPLKFRRSMVSKIDIQGGNSLHYRGPTNLDEWHQTPEDSWQYKRQSFISRKPGSIARDNILPEQCSISFTMERKSEQFDLKLMIFSKDIKALRPLSGYEISIQSSSIMLRDAKTSKFLGRDTVREFTSADRARIEIRANRKTGNFVLLVDGKIKEVWTDSGANARDFGSALHFISENNKDIRISDIQIGPWDGRVDHIQKAIALRFERIQQRRKPIEQEPEDPNPIKLVNGDSIEGDVGMIEDDMITLNTSLGEIKLPINRLRSLNITGLDNECAKRERNDIRAHFADGSTLVFLLDEVTGNQLVGTSQNFGTATFDLSAINRIDFDIYNEKLKSLRSNKDW